MKAYIGCAALILTILASPIVIEKSSVYLNKRKVDQLCLEKPVLTVVDKGRWDKWKNKVDDFTISNNITVHKGWVNKNKKLSDFYLLRNFAKSNNMYIIDYRGFPYKFPYDAVYLSRIYLYDSGYIISYIDNYSTFYRNGIIFRFFFGNVGSAYACKGKKWDSYIDIAGNYFYDVPSYADRKWRAGDMK